MKVLIVKLSALGDVLRTTSLLKPLRRRCRGAKIWWLTDTAAVPLLKGNPLIDKILTAASHGAGSALGSRLQGRFDLVLSLEEDPVTARIALAACRGEFVGVYPGVEGGPTTPTDFLMGSRTARLPAGGAPPRSGPSGNVLGRRRDAKGLRYTASSARYYDMSLLNRGPGGGLARANRLKAENRLSYARLWLKVLGLPVPKNPGALRPILHLHVRDRRSARDLARRHGLKPGRAVGFNPGAGKRWPAKQLSETPAALLAAGLHRRFGRPVLIFGGRDESGRNRRIVSRARRFLGGGAAAGRAVIDAGTRHDLRSFAGIVELCGAVVSTDSLAFHIATAFGKPVVALIGPTSAAELDVFGRGGKAVPEGGCSCFYKSRCRLKKNCLDRIEESAVFKVIGRWLR